MSELEEILPMQFNVILIEPYGYYGDDGYDYYNYYSDQSVSEPTLDQTESTLGSTYIPPALEGAAQEASWN